MLIKLKLGLSTVAVAVSGLWVYFSASIFAYVILALSIIFCIKFMGQNAAGEKTDSEEKILSDEKFKAKIAQMKKTQKKGAK